MGNTVVEWLHRSYVCSSNNIQSTTVTKYALLLRRTMHETDHMEYNCWYLGILDSHSPKAPLNISYPKLSAEVVILRK